jgi:hypothetical protein
MLTGDINEKYRLFKDFVLNNDRSGWDYGYAHPCALPSVHLRLMPTHIL